MIAPGALLTLDVEKAAAGGRMLARHEGQVVFVWGAIPGERVRARVERVGKGVVYADTIEVLASSSDRRQCGSTPSGPGSPGPGRVQPLDWRCGGNVYAHIAYARQVALKGEIIRDAFGRIGRAPLAETPDVVPSPEEGYRMRARLHVRGGRIGFYREGTHDLCDATATRQLLPATNEWIRGVEEVLRGEQGIAGIEIAENVPGDQRAHVLDLHEGADTARIGALSESLGTRRAVTDAITVSGTATLTLRRDVRAFFQGNRFLLGDLVRHVTALVPAGPVVDLYAGVGLFGLSLAAAGAEDVTLVEGDPASGADLRRNAAPYEGRVRVERRSVESYLASAPRRATPATVIVDPPRTGMTRDAIAGILRSRPARLVYVSCDVATLARDARTLLDAGYALDGIAGFDLFPNTAHVESVALFRR
jgi:tRNA/tmRNA/rRNA uracil-C5-methylase (TrmA/RlmC/RlmD family)